MVKNINKWKIFFNCVVSTMKNMASRSRRSALGVKENCVGIQGEISWFSGFQLNTTHSFGHFKGLKCVIILGLMSCLFWITLYYELFYASHNACFCIYVDMNSYRNPMCKCLRIVKIVKAFKEVQKCAKKKVIQRKIKK